MALWPTGFDPYYGMGAGMGSLGAGLGGMGLDPFGGMGWGMGGLGPMAAPGGVFIDPFFWTPGASGTTRRRLNAPTGGATGGAAAQGEAGAGAGTGAGAGAGEGEGEGGRRTREPFTVGSAGWTRSIPVDVIERESEYVVRADIPGIKKSEIHVEVHDGNVLRFGHNPNAEREKEDVEEEGIFHRAERVTTFRNRNLRMPDDADMSAQLQAKYEDGVLHITVPKKAGAKREGRIVDIA